VNPNALKVFNEATLQVSRSTGFDSGVDEAFSASHTMEVEFLRSQTSQEATADVST